VDGVEAGGGGGGTLAPVEDFTLPLALVFVRADPVALRVLPFPGLA
jgi:hypothetical protein